MRKFWISAALLLTTGLVSQANVDESQQQLFKSAIRQADILNADSAPFRMEVEFRAQFQTLKQGRLTLHWASKTRLQKEISSGDYKEVDIRNGEDSFMSRNSPFTPVAASKQNRASGLEALLASL